MDTNKNSRLVLLFYKQTLLRALMLRTYLSTYKQVEECAEAILYGGDVMEDERGVARQLDLTRLLVAVVKDNGRVV